MNTLARRAAALAALATATLALALASPSSSSSSVPYDACGQLVQGVTCPLLFLDDQGQLWLLEDYGGFQLGDRVRVTGDADAGCFSICNQGNGCIYQNTIGDCGVGTRYCQSTPNSTGQAARIDAEGSASVSAGDLVLVAAPVPNQPGIFFFGGSQIRVAFGNGFLCVGGPISRFPVQSAIAGELRRAVDYAQPPASGQLVAGSTWNFQAWFRDPAAGGAAFDTSDALSITFEP